MLKIIIFIDLVDKDIYMCNSIDFCWFCMHVGDVDPFIIRRDGKMFCVHVTFDMLKKSQNFVDFSFILNEWLHWVGSLRSSIPGWWMMMWLRLKLETLWTPIRSFGFSIYCFIAKDECIHFYFTIIYDLHYQLQEKRKMLKLCMYFIKYIHSIL